MQVTEFNDVKVYNLSAGKSTPQFEEEAAKKRTSLRYNQDYRSRVDLVQDFEFNTASGRVRTSPDGEFIAATGIYPPEVKLFECRELGMKCSRGLNAEVVDFIFLSEDYRKLIFLLDDRTLEFHAQYGRHHRIRVPKAGRSLCYDHETCTLFVGGSSTEVVRVDLETGTWHAPLALAKLEEVHEVAVNPTMPVVSCAGNGGIVESYDLREASQPLQSLAVCKPGEYAEDERHITCCAYSPNGMQFAAGTSGGLVRVYDVRSSKPLAERDHMNGYGIKTVTFHKRSVEEDRLLVASADKKSIKLWDAQDASIKASLESNHTINHMNIVPESGLILVANDQPRIGAYFIPSIGLAPKWCSFLDNMTEELEESRQKQVFDDYQFVTNEQLEQLGAVDLVGTKFLQPYMHGFFMDHRLYGRLKSAMDPFAFEEYRKKKIRERLEAKRTMRTKVKKKEDVSKVNPKLQEQLQTALDDGNLEGASKKRKDAATRAQKLLTDDRFDLLFNDPDFAIAEQGVAAEAKSMPSLEQLTGSLKKRKVKKP
eukprot:TRINITY_DN122563_c0_g1_i1.p1 TRINITY_DN122563_c0_g1~~TRINITY_DN122563_c0_g1_i1.p1  ORF type:complete len:539 (+),score=148.81 TRINITY_DN122563_c0_g1_i1:123-1739(+)